MDNLTIKNVPELKLKYEVRTHPELPHVVKFSGGRSSGMMLFVLLESGILKADRGDVIVFNNTTTEHPATYNFARRCKELVEEKYGIPFYWVEFQTYEDARGGEWTRLPSYRLVKSVPRSDENPDGFQWHGEAFEELLSFRGFVPNFFHRTCTSHLKLETTRSFLKNWFAGQPEIERLGHFGDSSRIDKDDLYERHCRNNGKVPKDIFFKKKAFVCSRPVSRPAQQFVDFSTAYGAFKNSYFDKKRLGNKVHLGEEGVEYLAFVGLRSDEMRRVVKVRQRNSGGPHAVGYEGEHVYMPLSDTGITAEDIEAFWKKQDWNLELNSQDGLSNCTYCFLKGLKGLQRVYTILGTNFDQSLKDSPCDLRWWIELEQKYGRDLKAEGRKIRGNMPNNFIGNGHLTVIPASDLRYVLYGGRTENGEMVGSGHAILASHEQSGTRRSKDGFYVKSFRDDLFDPYVFPENGEIPSYIKDKLEWIADEWKPGAGAVVAVPGFNRFRENGKSFWDLVSKAAACNFFAAFATGELRIEFEEGRVKKFLDKSNIAATIEKFSTEKRTRSGFLSGSRALITFETIKKGEDIWVDTDIGRIFMRLHDAPSLSSFSRVELCRNGMWITDDLPKLQRHRFTDFKPFHCVILLNAADGEIHRIVRKAEGPLHNHLTTKWLSIDEKKKLTAAMEAVFQEIKKRVPKYENEEFEIEDVLSITSYGISSGGRRPGVVGQFREIRRPPRFQNVSNTEDVEGGPEYDGSRNGGRKGGGVNNNKRGRGTFRRSGNALQFSALPVPMGKRSYRVDLKSGEKTVGSEIRFALDESIDESCDVFGSEVFAMLKNVKIDGQPVPENMLTCNDDAQVLGVRLGPLFPEKEICIEFDYELPKDIHLADDIPVVLKTQLIRRAASSDNQETK